MVNRSLRLGGPDYGDWLDCEEVFPTALVYDNMDYIIPRAGFGDCGGVFKQD